MSSLISFRETMTQVKAQRKVGCGESLLFIVRQAWKAMEVLW